MSAWFFKQVFSFGIVGILAFIIDYSLFALLTEVVGINYLISATVSFIVALIFNYVLSMRYVFTRKQNLKYHTGFVIFAIGALIGLGINNLVLFLGVEMLNWHPLVVKLGATVVVALWNFFTRKKFLDEGVVDFKKENPYSS